jgi:hypothetical protein
VKVRNDIETWSAGCMVLAVVILLVSAVKPDASPSSAGGGRPAHPLPPLGRTAAQLPAGVRLIPERTGFVAREDVRAGMLNIPSGKLAVDDFWYGDPQLVVEVPPGRHAVRATIADNVGAMKPAGSAGDVALVTVITGTGTPVRWRRAGTMGTDGGTGGFASAEASEVLRNDASEELHDRLLSHLNNSATRDRISELRVGHQLNVFSFPAGLGDGGYSIYVGTDAAGTVARVVFDGALLHLAWPR